MIYFHCLGMPVACCPLSLLAIQASENQSPVKNEFWMTFGVNFSLLIMLRLSDNDKGYIFCYTHGLDQTTADWLQVATGVSPVGKRQVVVPIERLKRFCASSPFFRFSLT